MAVLTLAAWSLTASFAFKDRDLRSEARTYGLATLLPLATGFLVGALNRYSPLIDTRNIHLAFDAFWTLVFVGVVAYALVKFQLFDIELRIRWTLQQAIVYSFFAIAFLTTSESIERLFNVDGTIPGILVALLIALAIRPLEALAATLAKRLMPHVEDTDEYRTSRRLDVYRATLEKALRDGEITNREARLLRGLRQDLELPRDKALRVEREVIQAIGPPTMEPPSASPPSSSGPTMRGA